MSININNASTIAENIDTIELLDSGLKVIVGNETKSNLYPKIVLEFDDHFHLCHYDKIFLKNLARQWFGEHYFCGDGVNFSSKSDVLIKSTVSDNRYYKNIIYLSRSLTNPIVFLHEIIHAIIDGNDISYRRHNEVNSLCSHLDVYTNEAPGFLLDIVNRLEMHFTPNELGDIQHGMYYLPKNIYPSLNDFCSQPMNENNPNNPISHDNHITPVCDDVSNLPTFSNNISIVNLESRNRNTSVDPKISEQKFLQLKFGDEWEILSTIKGFPAHLTKQSYIKLNLSDFNSRKKK